MFYDIKLIKNYYDGEIKWKNSENILKEIYY